ncbi:unannotated protein [freshwater metagenome]|uniref:Unannotated protein n=1 Tax=freshwater metagenome TaxID=449393 RepID=A0A6J6J246_9ZZZZ|nr:hypothetical protein [Actinomycetota bacterium]
MSRVSIALAEIDYSTPVGLKLNAITALMSISAVGILTVMVLSITVSLLAFFGKRSQDLSQQHFTRS